MKSGIRPMTLSTLTQRCTHFTLVTVIGVDFPTILRIYSVTSVSRYVSWTLVSIELCKLVNNDNKDNK